MNVAITGITGMVGSHLIKKLCEENREGGTPTVRALIREGSVVDHLKAFEDVNYVIGGLEDKESLAKLVDGRRETIVCLEKGKYNPSLRLAYDISRIFKVNIEEVFIFED